MTTSPRLQIDMNDVAGSLRDRYTVAGPITAFAGGGQGSAVRLTNAYNRVTTVATAGDSVRLPPALAGASIVVFNKAAANSLNIFPNTGDAINALAANAAYAMVVARGVMFVCVVTGTWDTIFSA